MPLRDSIITSETAARMLGRVSPIYDESYVGLWMIEAIGREYDALWALVNEFPDQLFPATATWGLELWERRYGITPSPTQTLQQRREAVIARQQTHSPISPYRIERELAAVTSAGIEVKENVAPYTFAIVVDDVPRADVEAGIRRITNKIKPSHMAYNIEYYTTFTGNINASGVFAYGGGIKFQIRQVTDE